MIETKRNTNTQQQTVFRSCSVSRPGTKEEWKPKGHLESKATGLLAANSHLGWEEIASPGIQPRHSPVPPCLEASQFSFCLPSQSPGSLS